MRASSRVVFALVALCFIISGTAGLIYQVVWTRYLALFLGHTSYAVVAVLVAFMGGLAVGNAVFGVVADRVRRPLTWYGWIEIGIALYALAFPHYFDRIQSFYVDLARSAAASGGTGWSVKFLFSLLLILLPTVLMGATFPVLTRFVTRSLGELRERVAALYFMNSAGAVLGCLITEYWWIPAYGLELTVFGAATLNVIAGVVALGLGIRAHAMPEETTPGQAPTTAAATEEVFTAAQLRWAIIGIGVSGFVAMLYEVAWTRLLALVLGSSTHAFSLMLITFISGIAAGAAWVYRWRRLQDTFRAFAWAELALALSVLVSMFFYHWLPFWFSELSGLLSRRPEAYPIYQLLQALVCFGVMFVPTLCLGLTLPLVSRIATAELSRTGRSVGRVFAVNTVGTVLGAVVTGLWLLPALGLAQTFAVGVVLNGLVALAMFGHRRIRWPQVAGGLAGGLAFVWIVSQTLDGTWKRALSLGLWRSRQPPLTREAYLARIQAPKLLFAHDGSGSTVVVESHRFDEEEDLSLKVNGKVEAGTALDVSTQRLLSHIPLLLRPQSTNVLVVGLGSGMTAAAAARHPNVARVDVAEISPEVIAGASYFAAHNDQVLSNPRVRVVVDDAKSFLLATDTRYDIIISEPSNPWMAGVAGVFTREYYDRCLNRLADDGLMVQWVQIYETNDETLDLVLRTFTAVFPHLSIWQPSTSDLVLIGTRRPFTPRLADFLRGFTQPPVLEDMKRMELDRPAALLACEVVSAENGAFIMRPDGPIHSDYYPELEFRAQEAFFTRRSASQWMVHHEGLNPRPGTLLAEYLRTHRLQEDDFKTMMRYHLEYAVPDPTIVQSMLLRWQADHPRSTLPMELSTRLSTHGAPDELEVLRFAGLRSGMIERASREPEPLRLYTSYALKAYRARRSALFLPSSAELEENLKALEAADAVNRRVYQLYRAELAWDRGDDTACADLVQQAVAWTSPVGAPDPYAGDPSALRTGLRYGIRAHYRLGRIKTAQEWVQFAVTRGLATGDPALAAVCRKVHGLSTRVP